MADRKSAQATRKLRLTAFLIKRQFSSIEAFLEIGPLRRLEIADGSASGTLFFDAGHPNPPSWVALFSGVEGFDPARLTNRSCRAVYVIREQDRWLCFTFGFARHLINDAAIERNFGLRVSLNLGDPESIKAIEKSSISHLALQSKEQASRDSEMDGFEFNVDVDLLKSITAKSPEREGEDQETYSGRDSISLYVRTDLSTMSGIARRLLKAFQSKRYKSRYPWIDKISEERDEATIQRLDAALVEGINSGAVDKVWLAIPEFISWEDVEDFSYRPRRYDDRKPSSVTRPDVDLSSWLADLKLEDRLTLDHLKHKRIYQIFKDGRQPAGWPVYRCLNAEIDLGANKYILNDGDWYFVNRDFVAEVDAFYAEVPVSALRLPGHGYRTEPEYLDLVVRSDRRFALMDRKNIPIGGGKGKVEFCDLFSNDRDIVHVKQYGGSSLLSHLFSQAVVSAECFFHEPAFRQAVNAHLPASHVLNDPSAAPDPTVYKICLAIMSRVPGPLELPFFSKVSLRNALSALKRMNLNATLLKIEA